MMVDPLTSFQTYSSLASKSAMQAVACKSSPTLLSPQSRSILYATDYASSAYASRALDYVYTQPPSSSFRRLPEKVAADRDGLLVAFAYSEIGVLNNVIELWRYPSAAACLR